MLRRRSPLKRSNKPLVRRKRINRVSKRRREITPWMHRCRAATMYRAMVSLKPDGTPLFVRCEECQRILAAESMEWHHIFGRNLAVPGRSKWCHVKELSAALCGDCHRRVTSPALPADLAMNDRLRRLGAIRLAVRLGMERADAVQALVDDHSPIALVRQCVKVLADAEPGEP